MPASVLNRTLRTFLPTLRAHMGTLTQKVRTPVTAATLLTLSSLSMAEMTLTSQDIQPGKHMPKAQEFQGFGCQGDNLSPQLSWSDAPEGTRSFAVTAYDPDAPTGSGWWHWLLVNIPAEVQQLDTNSGHPDNQNIPAGSQHFTSDYGVKGFGGACPPPGHGPHRYQFTVFALKTDKLELPDNASAAMVGYFLNANKLATATLETLYER